MSFTGETESVLRTHARKYPLMRPRDAVKLIYQNEFGGGHLITDEAACLERLRREYAESRRGGLQELCEDIGGGMTRVMLAALDTDIYPLEALCRDFIISARLHTGGSASFERKLRELKRLTELGVFRFSGAELADYLAGYDAAGRPAVSHSDEYRLAYRPAYRVVLKSVFERGFRETR